MTGTRLATSSLGICPRRSASSFSFCTIELHGLGIGGVDAQHIGHLGLGLAKVAAGLGVLGERQADGSEAGPGLGASASTPEPILRSSSQASSYSFAALAKSPRSCASRGVIQFLRKVNAIGLAIDRFIHRCSWPDLPAPRQPGCVASKMNQPQVGLMAALIMGSVAFCQSLTLFRCRASDCT